MLKLGEEFTLAIPEGHPWAEFLGVNPQFRVTKIVEAPMAKLTTKARKKLPKGEFAGPGRSYPVNDKAHAANAKARATQMVEKGKLSPSAAAKIKAKANKVLKKGK